MADLMTVPHDGHGPDDTCPGCPRPPYSVPTAREAGDEGIAAVLAAHEWVTLDDGLPGCRCGWINARVTGPRPTHRTHVAEALAPLIAERERAARAEDREKLQAIIREQALAWLALDDQAQELMAKVARVEALADEWDASADRCRDRDGMLCCSTCVGRQVAAASLRAALAEDES